MVKYASGLAEVAHVLMSEADIVNAVVDDDIRRTEDMIECLMNRKAFTFLGRRVLFTFEDNGKPPHEDEQMQRLFGREQM